MTHPDRGQVSEAVRLPVAARLAVVVTGALLGWLGIAALTTRVWGEGLSLARHAVSAVAALIVAGVLVVAARRLLDRRPVGTLGLSGGRRAVRDLVSGALSWLVPAAVGLAVALAAGWLRIEIDATLAETVGAVLLLVVLVLVYEAFPEELLFRGYVYRNLTAAMAPWLAVLVQALLFMLFGTALWVITEGWGVLLERLVLFLGMGVVVGCIRLISGSVWATVGWHLAFQVVMQLVVSGQYLEVTVSDETVFVVATAVVAFATSPTVAGFLWPGKENWTRPEPDVVPGR
ncbi:CPBP family intramembrane glutamic endopeptidase [Oceanitalea stevensii]|uniref:CPBP family intramembrane metalloprotease n=1 Tax=Oceanitalea stevensii TaxID=2763072 RepID=A0ABR8Z264_9MICO|nr:CPBP family intramembrane glutamic endopeptidase [Oceanitalea stevensii]MBD8062421.1 CPBP family intramembrane metalloprotease [Oceanitalea stevensii]